MEPERKEVFQILEGEEQIILKADEILNNVEKEVLIFISEYDIANFYHSGILDKPEKTSKKSVRIKLLTNYSPKSCFFIEKIKLKKLSIHFQRLMMDCQLTFWRMMNNFFC